MNIVKSLKNGAVSLIMAASVIAGVAFLAPTPHVSAAACTDQSNILTFPTWYRGVYVNNGTECTLFPANDINGVWVVVTNVVEILIQAVGYVAVGFIIYGGFRYVTSQGESSAISEAKTTITRAIVGLVISIVSVLILNVTVGIFGLRISGNCSEITPGATSSATTGCTQSGTSNSNTGSGTGTGTGSGTGSGTNTGGTH